MSNPEQLSSANNGEFENQTPRATKWDTLIEYQNNNENYTTEEVEVPLEKIAKQTSTIEMHEKPTGSNQHAQEVVVTDAKGNQKGNLRFFMKENGEIQIAERYYSLEEMRQATREYLEADTDDKFLGYVRKDDEEMRILSPPEAANQIMASLLGVGSEANLSPNQKFTNQDARSVEVGGPNGEVQHGVFMLGNQGPDLPNKKYVESDTVKGANGQYIKVSRLDDDQPIPPIEKPDPNRKQNDDPEATTNSESASENKDLDQARKNLAEYYARNRRLIVGRGNREEFESAKQEYQQLLTEHLSEVAHRQYDDSFKSMSGELKDMADKLAAQNIDELTKFVGGDLEHPNKSPEEIAAKREELLRAGEAKMKEAYPDVLDNLETTVNAKMIEEYVKQRGELEAATIEALDNGSICRKAVSKIINNKWLKRGLAVASATGLAVAAIGIGQGVADGTLAVSLGYTASGIAAGVARGGLASFFMSRESSRSSAIKGYGDDETSESLSKRVASGEHITAEDLAAESMSDYTSANAADAKRNKLGTTIATGVGAAIGAAASGIHVDNIEHRTVTEQVQTGTETQQIQIGRTSEQLNPQLDKIDIRPGSGMSETFTDLGGDMSNYQKALEIAYQYDAQHNLVPGSNGVTTGFNGQVGSIAHTYPGPINTWPEQARTYITEVAQEWAKQGLVPAVKTGGEAVMGAVESPVYSIVEKAVVDYLPNKFYEMLTQATAMASAGVVGSALQ